MCALLGQIHVQEMVRKCLMSDRYFKPRQSSNQMQEEGKARGSVYGYIQEKYISYSLYISNAGSYSRVFKL